MQSLANCCGLQALLDADNKPHLSMPLAPGGGYLLAIMAPGVVYDVPPVYGLNARSLCRIGLLMYVQWPGFPWRKAQPADI